MFLHSVNMFSVLRRQIGKCKSLNVNRFIADGKQQVRLRREVKSFTE